MLMLRRLLRQLEHQADLLHMPAPSSGQLAGLLLRAAGNRDRYRVLLTQWSIQAFQGGLRAQAYDLCHAHDQFACLAAPDGVPVVWTVHGPMFEEAAMLGLATPANAYGRFILETERQAAGRADRIICVDQGQRELLLKRNPDATAKIRVIENAADLPALPPASSDPPPYLLCARRLVEKNGVEYAIRSMAEDGMDDRMLRIAGDGVLRAKLEHMAAQLGVAERVEFLGEISDPAEMARLVREARIVLVPSVPAAGVVEATSIAALEAMALARPVIASGIGGLAELISHEQTGLLVPAGDPQALAQAVQRLWPDEARRTQLGHAAQVVARTRFGPERWIQATLDVYTQALHT